MLPHEIADWVIPKLEAAGYQYSLSPSDHPLTGTHVRITSQTWNGQRDGVGKSFSHNLILEIEVPDAPGALAMRHIGNLFLIEPDGEVEDVFLTYGTDLTFVSEGSGFLNPTTAQVTMTLEYTDGLES